GGAAPVVFPAPPDVVQGDVAAAEPVERLCAQRGNAVGSADVCGDDVVRCFVRHRPRSSYCPRAPGTQSVCDALADATGATRDQRGPAGELVNVSHDASLAPATD